MNRGLNSGKSLVRPCFCALDLRDQTWMVIVKIASGKSSQLNLMTRPSFGVFRALQTRLIDKPDPY